MNRERRLRGCLQGCYAGRPKWATVDVIADRLRRGTTEHDYELGVIRELFQSIDDWPTSAGENTEAILREEGLCAGKVMRLLEAAHVDNEAVIGAVRRAAARDGATR